MILQDTANITVNEFRRAVRHLRSGIPSPSAARLINVGTDAVETDLRNQEQDWVNSGFRPRIEFVLGDWGFGKTHLKLLLVDSFLRRGIPFIYDNVDARCGSLGHLHRAVPRWMESVQVGNRVGLRSVVEGQFENLSGVLSSCDRWQSPFSRYISRAISGNEWAWSFAAGHHLQSRDYGQNHFKALQLFNDFTSLISNLSQSGIVLMLDEMENISRQHDIRGRRKTYHTLETLATRSPLLTIIFVTDRFFHQTEEDKQRGTRDGWYWWTSQAKNFLARIDTIPVFKPPHLNARLARALVGRVAEVYGNACGYAVPLELNERVLDMWNKTSTKSVRLLVRLAIDTLDRSLPEFSAKGAPPMAAAALIGRPICPESSDP